MSAPPLTQLAVTAAEAEKIRDAVREPDLSGLGPDRIFASAADASALLAFLSDPAVSDPIYDLPRPFSVETIVRWIADLEAARQRGEGLLVLTRDADGQIVGYSCFTVWPERSAAEIAGATRADRQGAGQGRIGAARSFGWMFEALGVRLIGLTAALDNHRSAKVIESAGFRDMGQRDSVRPDGTVRRSRYWELTRDEWSQLTAKR